MRPSPDRVLIGVDLALLVAVAAVGALGDILPLPAGQDGWPDERLVRLLLLRPLQKERPPARRSKERPGR